ncbi:MAG TPA: hypothetical protein VE053_00340 [Allosphingosinicella sp.]|nr:hypothetical protein [Allosphingosinicella sp.]
MQKHGLWIPALFGLAACNPAEVPTRNDSTPDKVATSGKTEVPIAEVPKAVLAAASAAQPGFTPVEAESETRDGRAYFNIGGKLADGSEVEFDIMADGASWRVVETQRDIRLAAAPEAVREAAGGFQAGRVIESRQADGLVIYELYDSGQRKLEIKWDGKKAEALTKEWAH